MQRRFRQLKNEIWRLLVTEDAFGLKPREPFQFVTNRFQFQTDDEKLKSFNRWFANQVKRGVLQTDHEGKPWTAKYVDSAYKKGRIRAYLDSHQEDYTKPEAWLAGSREQFLRRVFMQPEAMSKLRLLGTRNFEQLKGITADMSAKLNRVLASGMAAGWAPSKIARQIYDEIDGISKKRARVLAHTEIMHAHAEGQLDSFEELGVEELEITAEWGTAGDKRVCPRCNAMSGKRFTIAQARGIIPLHPNCVVGNTRIQTDNPLSVMRGVYSGCVFEIFTAKGRRFSVTENHVLLTQRGWVKAKFITKSDQLVDAATIGGLSFKTPDDYNNVPSVEDNFHSLLEFGEIHSVGGPNTRAEDFHGDSSSFDKKVDIVRPYGFLRDQFQSMFSGKGEQGLFMSGDIGSRHSLSLKSESYFSSLAVRLAAAADSFMGFHSVESVFLRGSFAHRQPIGLGLFPDFDPFAFQTSSDGSSITMEMDSELGQRNPGLVELNHFIHLLGGKPNRFSRGASGNPILHELFSDACSMQTEDFREFGERVSPVVEFDSVIEIETRHVKDLPVYDVETKETVYNLNGIVSSNCRCSWRPVMGKKPSKLGKKQIWALGGPLTPVKAKPKAIPAPIQEEEQSTPKAKREKAPTIQEIQAEVAKLKKKYKQDYKLRFTGAASTPQRTLLFTNQLGSQLGHIRTRSPALARYMDKTAPLRSVELTRDKAVRPGMVSAYKPRLGIKLATSSSLPLADVPPSLGGFTVARDVGSVFRHEYGRQLWQSYLNAKERANWGLLFEKMGRRARQVSRYAAANPQELWAEAFTVYMSPEYAHGMLPLELETKLEDLLLYR